MKCVVKTKNRDWKLKWKMRTKGKIWKFWVPKQLLTLLHPPNNVFLNCIKTDTVTGFRFRIKKQMHGPGNFATNRGLGLVASASARKGNVLLISDKAIVVNKILKPFFKSNSFFMLASNLFKRNDYTMLLNCVTATSSSSVETHNVKLVVHSAKHLFETYNYVFPSGNSSVTQTLPFRTDIFF